jgi:predicted ferric reductase
MGVAFIFAFFHVMLIGADVAANPWLKNYLWALGILAIGAYFYRAILGAVLVRNYKYKIKNIINLPDKTVEIEFEPAGKKMDFIAGQFTFVKFYGKNLSHEAHPFSMSSAPGEPLKFGIKELGDFTSKIKQLKEGDLAKIEGPFGAFNFKNYSKSQVWIAGGIGITPFISMTRSLTPADSDCKIDLYFSVRDEESLIYKNEIENCAKLNKNLNVILWRTNLNGFLTAEAICKKTSDIKNRDILICGSGAMMSAIKKQLFVQGIEPKKIHAEEFKFY